MPFPLRVLVAAALALACVDTHPQAPQTFPPEQVKRGAETFATFCTPCHGERMSNPELFNLREFPRDQRARFLNSVANGKGQMPPWRGQLQVEDIEALWAYVATGEK